MAGTFLLLTLWLQLVSGLSPLQVGVALVPLQLAMVVATLSAPRLARHVRPGTAMAGGLVLAAAGMATVATAGPSSSPLLVLGGFLVASMGVAMPAALGTDLVVGSVPPAKAGSAGALSETGGELGVALGVAVLGSVAAAVFRGVLVVPPGTPPAVAERAGQGLTEAAGVAAQGPPALVGAVHQAFTAGVATTATLGALLFAALAGVAVTTLRAVPRYGAPAARVPESAAPAPAPARA